MAKFDELTRYIPALRSEEVGKWAPTGGPDVSLQFPFVVYSGEIRDFERDFFAFCESHPEYNHTRYGETLEVNGIQWGSESMKNADVCALDEKAVIALIVGAFRAERFCDGALLDFINSGAMLRWLERLEEIDFHQ